jgi:hypothetical protein
MNFKKDKLDSIDIDLKFKFALNNYTDLNGFLELLSFSFHCDERYAETYEEYSNIEQNIVGGTSFNSTGDLRGPALRSELKFLSLPIAASRLIRYKDRLASMAVITEANNIVACGSEIKEENIITYKLDEKRCVINLKNGNAYIDQIELLTFNF